MRTAPGSPAERAGIRGVDFDSGAIGDVIVEADGKPVHRLSDLTDTIEQIGAGKRIRIGLKRGSQARESSTSTSSISAALDAFPSSPIIPDRRLSDCRAMASFIAAN